MYVCIYIYIYICMCVCMYICMCVCMYVCIYVCMYVCIYMYVCMYIMYVYIYYVCMYVCVYMYISTYLIIIIRFRNFHFKHFVASMKINLLEILIFINTKYSSQKCFTMTNLWKSRPICLACLSLFLSCDSHVM